MRDDSRRAIFIGILTFLLTLGISTISNGLARQMGLIASFIALFVMIMIGILFDIIGVAAAAAIEKPFHAMSAKKVYGARHALKLVRNADAVSAFSNDVIGDIAGTVSGALAMGIVIRLMTIYPNVDETIAVTLLTALVAALTVGGKARGKVFAMTRATEILHFIGKTLEWVEKAIGLKILNEDKNIFKGSERRRRRRLKKS